MSASPASGEDELMAVNVLIEPGPKMVAAAERWNASMREQHPEGFRLDPEHVPHVTLVQRFIARSDLPAVLAAVDRVRSEFDIGALDMTAIGLYHVPIANNGLAGIVIQPTPQLRALQQAVIEAINGYARTGGGESAFVPDSSGTAFAPFMLGYVETFVPQQTAEKFNPHVTVGLAPLDWLQELETKPFDRFTFGAAGLATYQLGNFGTAARRLPD
jgi:2'-5' RNA ligase